MHGDFLAEKTDEGLIGAFGSQSLPLKESSALDGKKELR